jgi:hypothetical protein
LTEIARKLKQELPDNPAIIFVTFNDGSPLQPWEQDNPGDALCRRIAFAAARDRDFRSIRQYESYQYLQVSLSDIDRWLSNDYPCILLIDEFNQLDVLGKQNSPAAQQLINFLVTRFLKPKNRYFLFSSHIVSTTLQLTEYMDNLSMRGVSVVELPIIPNLPIACDALKYQDLTARTALFYGLVPALIFESSRTEDFDGTFKKREKLISDVVDSLRNDAASDDAIRNVLTSFIDGDPAHFVNFPKLLQLMSVSKLDSAGRRKENIVWIPFHMLALLSKLTSLSSKYQRLLKLIVDLFRISFIDSKNNSGDGWECLFLIVLLIRLATGQFDMIEYLEKNKSQFQNCPISYNDHYRDGSNSAVLGTKIWPFLHAIVPPPTFPHIVVYYPKDVSFECYDVIVATYDCRGEQTLLGYQLKQGKKPPTKKSGVDESFHASYFLNGIPRKRSSNRKGWKVLGEMEIDAFFGKSGSNWTPKRWKELLPVSAIITHNATPTYME